ncbi:MAG TPA: polysaccharide biosynthesis C-terminal domain-containing protein, partial [Candidatus Limnocylindria bacterium]|nr:polysaccharide biosynthesis C-terminal domain-containing protein [Candidatus Limnocylindria bacterium]
STAAMAGLRSSLARAAGTPESAAGFLYIAPSLLFVCIMSAYRGYMQGHRRMVPTAISQLIEQVGKVAVALPLAYRFMLSGGYAMGAAGALLGTTIAEAVAMLYMAVDYHFVRPGLYAGVPAEAGPPESRRAVARELVFSAGPITIGACIVPLAGAVDSFMLVRLMQRYLEPAEALSRYGIYSGLVIALINVPTALAMATAASLVPSISARRAAGDEAGIRRDASAGLRLSMVIGLPGSVGMSLLAQPILALLFGGGKYSPEQLALGGSLLQVSSLTIVVFTLVQATSGILQGLYLQRIPMYTLMLGVGLKVAINYAAVRIPSVSIFGAPWASLVCYAVSAALNLYYVARHARLRFDLKELLLRPSLATLAMALPVALAAHFLGNRLQRSWPLMGIVLAGAVVIYVAAALRTGAVKTTELPGRLRRGH